MAQARAYDEWEDTGLDIGEEALASYRPAKWAEGRVAELGALIIMLNGLLELPDVAKEDWWKKARASMDRNASWYCVAMEIPALNPDDLGAPSRRSAAGKKVAAEVLTWEPKNFLGDLQATAEANMRYVVTAGRRCVAVGVEGWGKMDRKLNNRLANAVMKEIQTCARLEAQLESRKKSKAEREQEEEE